MIEELLPQAFGYWLERALVDRGLRGLDDVVVFGSAVMKLHGHKDRIGDVDLFVSQRTFAHLRDDRRWREERPCDSDPPFLATAVDDVAIHAFYAWTARDPWIDAPDCFAAAERVRGTLCIPLSLVAYHKAAALEIVRRWGTVLEGSPWEKHKHDLAVLAAAGVELSDAHKLALLATDSIGLTMALRHG